MLTFLKSIYTPNDITIGAPWKSIVLFTLPVLIGKMTTENEIIYRGPWGEFETLEMEWKNNEILLIYGEEFCIDTVR